METSKTLLVIIICFLLLISIPYGVLAAGTVTSFEVQPNDQTVAYNDTFSISIYVTPNGTIDTCAIDNLTFTPGVLSVLSVAQGNLFGGTTMWIPGIDINNESGYLTGILWTWGGETNTPGFFCNITFKAINPGIGYVNITSYGVALAGVPFTCNITSNATVTVSGLTVVADSATSITNSSATFNGHLTGDNGEPATCGFIYDNASHPNATGYSHNVTCSGTYEEGDSFSKTVNIDCATLYYYRAWGLDSSLFAYSSETSFRTPPGDPIDVTGTLTDFDGPAFDDLNISWTKGCEANLTIVRKNSTHYLDSPTEGVELYNDTSTYVVDINLTQPYYYTLWSYSNVSGVWMFSNPVNLSWGGLFVNVYDEVTFNPLIFDISITNQLGTEYYEQSDCTNTLVIPVSICPNGENIAIQISAAGSYNTLTEYFTGYPLVLQNKTITYVQLQYEPKDKDSTTVICYNSVGHTESIPEFLLSGSVITIYPNAADQFDQVNVTYTYELYKSRLYYMDIYENFWYSLNAYLPPREGAELYLITVVNPYEFPVEEAYVQFKTYSPITGMYESVSNLYTDANGQVNLYLIPDTLYKVVISKPGYETEIADYIPDPDIHTRTFRLEFETIDPSEYAQLFDNIAFSVDPEQRRHMTNFTIYYNITSSDNKLEWFRCNIHWYNSSNDTYVLLFNQNISGQSEGGSISYTVPNATGRYYVQCYFKKEGFDEYLLRQEGGSTRIYDIFLKGILSGSSIIKLIPDWIYLLVIVIIMMLVMAAIMPYAGLATGYVGIGIFGFALALKPTLVVAGTEMWGILLLTAIVYTAALFLWSRI